MVQISMKSVLRCILVILILQCFQQVVVIAQNENEMCKTGRPNIIFIMADDAVLDTVKILWSNL